MLEVQNLTKSYGELSILKDVSFSVKEGEIVSIVGSSGAGKTTLLQILGTLDRQDSGNFKINGIDPFEYKQKELARFRNKNIGFVFQFHQLLPEFNAMENIMIPSMISGVSKSLAKEKALHLLETVGLGARKNHQPSQLSGGEQQRIAVCRALINEPKIVFADEPTGNLDTKNAKELQELFLKFRAEFQQTFVIVTHNQQLAEQADRIITIKDGLIL